MPDVKGLKTFAIGAKNLAEAEKFYIQVLGARVVRRIEPTQEQFDRGRVKEVDVQLGNFQVHIFDASQGPRPGVPHHTLNIPWQEKEKAITELEQAGARVENIREYPDGKGYSLYINDRDENRWELSFGE